MTRDEMHSKVHMLGDNVIGSTAVADLIETVGNITALPRIDALTGLFSLEASTHSHGATGIR
jgi:hypothetical protein